jgi:FAD:protein FMN transferase
VNAANAWRRRARPQLGTLVEIGVAASPSADAAIDAGFAAIEKVEAALSAFRADSEVSRVRALPAGASMRIGPDFAAVLSAADEIGAASGGLFDATLHQARDRWRLDGDMLHLDADAIAFELGGIAKGHAVDRAVEALRAAGVADGWVNAGGDLRAFGAAGLPIALRDEASGGTRAFGRIADGAFATSRFGAGQRAQAIGPTGRPVDAHVSVAAPRCLWADALTKVVALSGEPTHPALARFGAQAWTHP